MRLNCRSALMCLLLTGGVRIVDAPVGTSSPLYLLERSDVGLVPLNRDLKVVAMNSFARRALPVEDKESFEKMVLSP